MRIFLSILVFISMCFGDAYDDAYDDGLVLKKSYYPERAIEAFTLAANHGHAGAQFELGIIYIRLKEDYKKAFEFFTLAANQGHAGAHYKLMDFYKTGGKTEKKKYYEHLTLAANLGDTTAQFVLGKYYEVTKDYKKAKDLYRKSCDGGFNFSCALYKYLTENGH